MYANIIEYYGGINQIVTCDLQKKDKYVRNNCIEKVETQIANVISDKWLLISCLVR